MSELQKTLRNLIDNHNNMDSLKAEFTNLPYTITEINTAIMELLIEESEKTIVLKQENLKRLFSKIPEFVLPEIYNASQTYGLPLESGVYFILNKKLGLVKIGCAIDIKSRFKQLKTAFAHVGFPCELQLLGVVLVYPKYIRKVEAHFHKIFNNFKEIGEWFKISYDDIFDQYYEYMDTGQVVFGENYFVDYTDYEFFYFPKMNHSYSFEQNSLEKFMLNDRALKDNKLQHIVDSVERNKVGFHAIYFDYKKEEMHKLGISYSHSGDSYDFQGIKSKKALEYDWDTFFAEINP